jgi:hypothetical protein
MHHVHKRHQFVAVWCELKSLNRADTVKVYTPIHHHHHHHPDKKLIVMSAWWSSSQQRFRLCRLGCWLVALVLVVWCVTDAFGPPSTTRTPTTAIARQQQNNCASTDRSIAFVHHHSRTQRKRELAPKRTCYCKSEVSSRTVLLHCGLYYLT